MILTGCSAGGSPTKDDAGVDCLAAGTASKSIEVSGETGTDLKLTTKAPITLAGETERSVLTEGEGDLIAEGQTVAVSMTTFNGTTGDEMDQLAESPVPFAKDQLVGWAYEGIRCAVPGQQVALVAPYAEMFAEADASTTGYEGLTEESPIVIVMEFGEITEGSDAATSEPGTLEADELLKKAEGTAQKAPEGFPTVKLAKDGAPTITMPEGVEPPTELQIATLIEGDGETVEPGDRVYVNYRGVIWRTGEEFDSSWSRGEPANFTTTGVIGGFQQALEGQKVGSQIISVVPAEDGGYGAATLEQQGHEADDVMVFVLDILGTVHAE
nr:FKBP-type peptidyl-prolyl cis-trans isomerase [Leucobacter luti]